MRSFLFAIMLAGACAHSSSSPNRPVNVASVRSEINGTIRAENGDRSIHSMGKVTHERATVFTTSKAGVKQEETWVKANGQWKLENASSLQATPASSTTAAN